jgi:hypothetical protein
VAIIRSLRSFAAAGLGLAACILFSAPAGAQAGVGITINGTPVPVEPGPIVQGGRVFVPLRGVFQDLGASVVYDNGQIDASGNGRDISLRIGSRRAHVNGSPTSIDVAPFIVGASTYVPLRFISESLGANVDWDQSQQLVAITMAGVNYQAPSDDTSYNDASYQTDTPPPPIPDYQAPPCPDQNYVWTPGYWSWGPAGYYWVPGTWVLAPQPGYLWTPGYWAWQNGYYGWNQGYWGPTIGFYGGINYGGGYYGNGWSGGRWSNGTLRYNTAVVHVNANIRNVYVDSAVVVNQSGRHVGFNGGHGGVAARPSAVQLTAAHAHHLPATTQQRQHVQIAAQNRQFLATVNHGAPPVTAVAHPFTPAAKPAGFSPVTAHDRAAAPVARRAPVSTVAHPVAPVVHPVERAPAAPVVHPVPASHPTQPRPAYQAPRPVQQQPRPVQQAPRPRQTPAEPHPDHTPR